MRALGIMLIIFGVLGGATIASRYKRLETMQVPPDERLGQAAGGALFSLALVGGGFIIARSGGKKSRAEDKNSEADPKRPV